MKLKELAHIQKLRGYITLDTYVTFEDSNSNFHFRDGPAILWDDGWKEYWIHGARVALEDLMNET